MNFIDTNIIILYNQLHVSIYNCNKAQLIQVYISYTFFVLDVCISFKSILSQFIS